MELLVIYLIVAVIFVVIKISKSNTGAKNPFGTPSGSSSGQKAKASAPARHTSVNGRVTRPDLRQTAENRVERLKYRATHADEGYDERMLDYCDSELSETNGISFKDIPKDSDELVYLRRYNHQREKELEKALQTKD